MAPYSSTLGLENPMDGGAWWAAVHGVTRSWTQLSKFTFTFHFHALEKEIATHSSVLAWIIPGTEEAGGLSSMGSHRVEHDWSNLAVAAAYYSLGFLDGSAGKEPACQCRSFKRQVFNPWIGKRPGEGNGNPLQYSCLGNPMDRGACGLQSMGFQRVRHDWVCMRSQLKTHVFKHLFK